MIRVCVLAAVISLPATVFATPMLCEEWKTAPFDAKESYLRGAADLIAIPEGSRLTEKHDKAAAPFTYGRKVSFAHGIDAFCKVPKSKAIEVGTLVRFLMDGNPNGVATCIRRVGERDKNSEKRLRHTFDELMTSNDETASVHGECLGALYRLGLGALPPPPPPDKTLGRIKPKECKPLGKGLLSTVAIKTTPSSEVWYGDEKLGVTPLEASLPSGCVRLRLVDPETARQKRVRIQLKPNKKHKVDLRL